MKIHLRIFFCFSIFISHFSFAQNDWLWGTNGKGNALIQSLATDNKGNCLAVGYLKLDTVHFGSYSLIDTGGNNDFFLMKIGPNGNVLWAEQTMYLESSKNAVNNGAVGVSTDGSGNSYLTATFNDSMVVGSNLLLSRKGVLNDFLAKYDLNGNVLWCEKSTCMNDSGQVTGFNVSCNNKGNTFITGTFIDTVQFGTQKISTPDGNILFTFLVKYDSNGNVKWVRQSTGNTQYDGGTSYGVATDRYGNSFITGFFIDSITFGSCMLSCNTKPSNGVFFITKYDSSGNVLWAKQSINSVTHQSSGWELVTDLSGNIYVEGGFTDTIIFGNDTLIASLTDPYQESVFLVKYDPNGNVLWAKQTEILDNNSWSPYAISVDKYNHVYFSGSGGNGICKIKFGDSTLQINDTVEYGIALFILKLDSNGNVLCNEIIPGGGGGGWSGLASDSSGNNIYCGGNTLIPLTFGSDVVNPYSNPVSLFWHPASMCFIARWEECDKTLGVNNVVENIRGVKVYPNPNNGKFILSLSNIIEQCTMEIYNILGESIYQTKLNSDNTEINLRGQPQGIYFYRVLKEDGGLVGCGKLIIEN